MSLLSSLFGTIVSARNRWYDTGRFEIKRLQGPVISVGNLSVGGTGKTPLVIALGKELAAHGIPYDILLRGYKRKKPGTLRLPDMADPYRYGDEPALLQQELQVPVYVARRRFDAGLVAERELGPQVHLLDDGFQHRSLHRDYDIVVLTPEDFTDELLPAGRLRESLQSLERADAVVLPEDFQAQELAFPGPVWRVRRRLVFDGDVKEGALAFCGIGKPGGFFELLMQQRIDTRAVEVYGDHHAYTEGDIRSLLRKAETAGAELLVTTSKDAVKLSTLQLPPEFSNRLRVARLITEITNAPQVMDEMLARLRERCPGWFAR